MNKNKLLIISILVIVVGFIFNKPSKDVRYGPGVMAPDQPLQTATDHAAFKHENFKFVPMADFDVQAKVLSKESYSFDQESKLSQFDLALGWGRMSDEAILKDIKISQRNRFYFWHVDEFIIPRAEIEQNSANMHMIPSSEYIERQLEKVKPGQVIRFSGMLVNIFRDDGWRWKSSLTRNDTGSGACEVVWLEDFEILSESELSM